MSFGGRRAASHAAPLLLAASLITAITVAATAAPQVATTVDAAAALSVTQDIPSDTLIGRSTPVTLTIVNEGDTTAYNLAISVTLPLGVSDTGAPRAPTRTITTTDAAGNPTGSVVVWENVVDLRPGVVFNFDYNLNYDLGVGDAAWEVGETAVVPAAVFASDVDSVVPTVTASPGTTNVVALPTPDPPDTTAAAPGQTTLVPVLLTKSEPSLEGELLRGVHDQQTIYTLRAETGTEGAVEISTLDDYLPAGIEFLGCGDIDHSTSEEYPGSGSLVEGNVDAIPAPLCLPPDLVETVENPGGRVGVFTHVQWDLSDRSPLPTNDVIELQYVAGIPLRENTMTWPDAVPATDGAQAANLDNNTGAATKQVGTGTTYTNDVALQTEFGGIATAVTAEETVEAVDLSVHKVVTSPAIVQGAISRWSLIIESSEYVVTDGVADLLLVDVTPDGTCPIDDVPRSPSCTTVTLPPPSVPYSTYAHDPGAGTTQLTWDLSAYEVGPNQIGSIGFSTEALTEYHDGAPVAANDTWSNHVDLTAEVTTFAENGPADPDTFVPAEVDDDSDRGQSGTPVQFNKEVGYPGSPGAPCGDGTGVAWQDDSVLAIGPGDRICYRLTIVPPDSLDTVGATLVDFLPPGQQFEASEAGPENEVPIENVSPVSVTGTPATGQRIQWRLQGSLPLEPSQVAQTVFSAIVTNSPDPAPDAGTSGDPALNTARVSFENTNGEIFVVPDSAGATFAEAELALTKGIVTTAPPVGPPTNYDPPANDVTNLGGGTVVTYRIDVTNEGSRDAENVSIRDLLPINNDGLTAEDATCVPGDGIGTISNGGVCVDATPDHIQWDALTVAAGTTLSLTYTWTLPVDEPPSTSWTNVAGVRSYETPTTAGVPFVYVPRQNVDPELEPAANTTPADDDANVSSRGVTMSKTRTTRVTGPGNAAGNQATIGEIIDYTVTTRQAAGASLENFVLTDSLVNRGQTLVAGSAGVAAREVTTGASCATGGVDISGDYTLDTSAANAVVVTNTGVSTSPVGSDHCVVLTFAATVNDVPVGSEALNRRPNSVTNQAVLTFDADTGAGTLPRTVRQSVSTQVVEPNLGITKLADRTIVYPTDEVEYTLTITNRTGTQVSAAHDLVVTDTFSDEVATVTAAGATVDLAANTITWAALPADPDGDGTAGLSPGASFQLTYLVTFAGDLVSAEQLPNTGRVTGTSLAGAVPGERSGADSGSPCSPATCPGYDASATFTLTVGGPTITKTALTPAATAGSDVVYLVEVGFPAHLDYGDDVTLTDDMALGGVEFVETIDISCLGCTPAELLRRGTFLAGGPTWSLGEVPAIDNARAVFFLYRARVNNDVPTAGQPVSGDVLTNTATLAYTDQTPQLTIADDADVPIAEPAVTLTKRVASPLESGLRETTPDDPVPDVAGLTVTYELALTNAGNRTAYDVDVTDLVDSTSVAGGATCTAGTPRVSTTIVSSAPGADLVDGELGTDDGCLAWNVPTILPGQTITIDYQLTIDDDFPRSGLVDGPEIINEATVATYFALVDYERQDNPDVRTYGPLDAAGHVDLAGGILGDFVWLDLNGNGVEDSGEPGIAGVGVGVSIASGPIFPQPDPTNGGGRWATGTVDTPTRWLTPGTYTVTVDVADLPPGLTNTFDPDGTLDSTNTAPLAENEIDLTRDFGYAGSATVGDTVWIDADDNGVQDAGEPGIPGVGVTVTWLGPDGVVDDGGADGDDVVYFDGATNASGNYLVGFLPAGQVLVELDESTLPDLGLVQTYDPDSILVHDARSTRTLTAGQVDLDADFGYRGTSAVGDLVWFDHDGDGAVDGLDAGIPGITASATWAGFDGDILTTADNVGYPAVLTDADGGYLVGGLPAGDVLVAVSGLPPGLAQTFDADGTLDDETVRTLPAGGDDLDADFGYTGTLTVGDLVWLDVDGNGAGPQPPDTDTAEPGVPGQSIVVHWAGANGIFDDGDDVVFAPATTDADGLWEVANVPAGDVRVTMVGAPANELDVTSNLDGDWDGTTPVASSVETTITQSRTDVDFGLAGRGSLGDLVWLDFFTDDVQEADEPGIPGADVQATWAGFDGDLATSDDNVDFGNEVTDTDGLYRFSLLPPGDFRVTVTGGVPFGLSPSFDLDGGADETAVRTLGIGEDATDVDFGYVGEGEIGDVIWWDTNGDGVEDPDEPGIPGVDVTIHWAGFDGDFATVADNGSGTITTDGDGGYLATGLPPGDYRVVVETATLPAGMRVTFDPEGDPTDSESTLTLGPISMSDLDQDFGYVGDFTLGDLVWSDINRDGVRQPSEPATAGVGIVVTFLGADAVAGGGDDVVVFDGATAPVASAPVAALVVGGDPLPGDPLYTAIGLVPGTYMVDLDEATLPAGYTPLDDLDGGDPTRTTIVITAASVSNADFSIFVNVAPDVSPETGNAVCGGTLVVNPLAGTSDVNGDALSVVPGSILAPAGVSTTLLPSGQLQIVTSPSVRTAYTVSWQVTDGRGGFGTVTLSVAVNCVDARVSAACPSPPPTLTWSLTGTSGAVRGPVTITWAGPTGNVLAVTTGHPLAGTMPWPNGTGNGGSIQVTLTTADGAVAGPVSVTTICTGALPATGSAPNLLFRLAAFGVLAGLALLLASRRPSRRRLT